MRSRYSIDLFVEDRGHEEFLRALVERFARDFAVDVRINFRNSRGGHGRVIHRLREYVIHLASQTDAPDLLIVATDGNCQGFLKRKQEIESVLKDYHRPVIYAIPDPHIERWFLLDSAAFKKAFQKSCSAPTQKCQRDLYKQLLLGAIRATGRRPTLGGIEYAAELVNEMDVRKLERADDSFGRLLKDLRQQFQMWAQR